MEEESNNNKDSSDNEKKGTSSILQRISLPHPHLHRKKENNSSHGENTKKRDETVLSREAMEKDDLIALVASLQSELADVKALVTGNLTDSDYFDTYYYSSPHAVLPKPKRATIPARGMSSSHVKERIIQIEQLDNKPRLNTSSYVNVVTEPDEQEVALLGLMTNLADASVYPASVDMHNTVVNMIAEMWNAPEPPEGQANYAGSGTVGSTEACLLAGLALKFRWRQWYAKKNSLSQDQVLGIRPNMVISTCFQAAWEKLFRYFDVEPKFVKPAMAKKFAIDAKKVAEACNEKTIGVVAILGNHYNGAYDPVWEIDEEIKKLNTREGYQIGIHVDAASGGFVAPFQDDVPPFDFRLDTVLSMSASGHKFGESICGTGWLAFRQVEDLAEHIAIRVTYLGGECDSMTLNFSRPASSVYVQYYKLLRLGLQGYRDKVSNQMKVAAYIRERLREMKDPKGHPRFELLDQGDRCCLPVVAARLNPRVQFHRGYDDIDLQHALAESHWYVSGYGLSFENFNNDFEEEDLFSDQNGHATMFRIVCKSNLTMDLAQDLADHIAAVLPALDKMKKGVYRSVRRSLVADPFKSRMMLLSQRSIAKPISDPSAGHQPC